jgi:hypothetical protein
LSSDALALQATSGYGRHAAVRAKADVRLINLGSSEARLATLQVRHPLFERLPPMERRTVLPPTVTSISCRSPSGSLGVTGRPGWRVVGSRCADLRRGRGGGAPAARPEPGLVRAHRLACATAAVEELVIVELRTDGTRTSTPRGAGLAMTLHCSARPRVRSR